MKDQIDEPKKVRARSVLGLFLKFGEKGEAMYTSKGDSHSYALAKHYGALIETERVLVITGTLTDPDIKPLTRVTIIKPSEQ